eukprot:scaffold60199_cov65-Cyclotella_meneghiniana.AAC.3
MDPFSAQSLLGFLATAPEVEAEAVAGKVEMPQGREKLNRIGHKAPRQKLSRFGHKAPDIGRQSSVKVPSMVVDMKNLSNRMNVGIILAKIQSDSKMSGKFRGDLERHKAPDIGSQRFTCG